MHPLWRRAIAYYPGPYPNPSVLPFNRQADLRTVRDWWQRHLSAGPPPGGIQFYVHIPWCVRRCSYCDLSSDKWGAGVDLDAYLDGMAAQMDGLKDLFAGIRFCQIYVGGGTPNLLKPAHLQRLMDEIDARFAFEDGIIRSIEFAPELTTPARLEAARRAGWNRVSFGIQSLDREVLRGVNRNGASRAKSLAAIRMAREAGIPEINADLIYGLGGETDATFHQGLLDVVEAGPSTVCVQVVNDSGVAKVYASPEECEATGDRFCDYRERLEREVASRPGPYRFRTRPRVLVLVRDDLPRPWDQWLEFWSVQDHPARSVLGFGLYAHSYLPGVARYQNNLQADSFGRKIDVYPARTGSPELEAVMDAACALMNEGAQDLAVLEARYGQAAEPLREAVDAAVADGSLRRDGTRILAGDGAVNPLLPVLEAMASRDAPPPPVPVTRRASCLLDLDGARWFLHLHPVDASARAFGRVGDLGVSYDAAEGMEGGATPRLLAVMEGLVRALAAAGAHAGDLEAAAAVMEAYLKDREAALAPAPKAAPVASSVATPVAVPVAAPVAPPPVASPAPRLQAPARALRRGPELLYVHPTGHLNDLVVSAGSLSCMNSVDVPRLGRFAFEVSDDEIRSARVVAADLHWVVGLPGFTRLSRHVRAVNPQAVLVAGGITAGHYAGELIQAGLADFVLRGDSEVAFATLVGRLLADKDPSGIPNVHSRDCPEPATRRMTNEEFDRTDCLGAEWFPTFQHVADWDAAAFRQGRTLPVVRGCAMRCEACYGSFASTFGEGVLVRSPEGLARNMERASREGMRNLKLTLGKIPPGTLTALLDGLVAAGPFDLDSAVGLLLCTPPSAGDLDRIEAAFRGRVALSMIPPEEHQPCLAPGVIQREMDQWRAVARRVAGSPRIHFDVWAETAPEAERLRREFGADAAPNVTVSLAVVWNVTRPTDGGERPALGDLHDTMDQVWTFYAARLLSPPLARALAPFRLLDEIPGDPEASPCPPDSAAAWWQPILSCWRSHRLPLLRGLVFAAVPVRAEAGAVRRRQGTRVAGDLWVGRVRAVAGAQAVVLAATLDHRGVRLGAPVTVPEGADGLAFVPLGPDGVASPDRIRDVLADEVVHLSCGAGSGALEVVLRVQDATVAWIDGEGSPRAGGRADLGYFRKVRTS